VLRLTSHVSLKDYAVDLSVPSKGPHVSKEELDYFLQPSRYVPTDGIVKETALKATAGATTEMEKARAIYDWVVDNTFRDPKVRGCGRGDIRFMLESGDLGGKCADLNALYVGLARSVGLPARHVYGLRIAKSDLGYKSLGLATDKATKGQHCRTEVYLREHGWVPVDPADVRKVVLEEPPGNRPLKDEMVSIAYDLAKKLKVKHIVYHSVFRVEHFKDVPHFASKLAIESALREFDVPFTVIRPNYFFQNDASLKDPLTKAGTYPMPLGAVGISAVDIRDIAEAAAIALTSDGHYGKTYNLNGPEVLSGPKVASIWSGLLGKEIHYPGENMDAFEEQMRDQAPSWSAFDIRMMFQGYLERGFVAGPEDLDTLTELLGHSPRRYEDFARQTRLAWEQSKEFLLAS
jgi:uncharacterized protein YbjT (DUF2867 family)